MVFDGAADIEEQLDAAMSDGFAVHEFTSQVSAEARGRAAIEHVGDVGMIERGQYAASISSQDGATALSLIGSYGRYASIRLWVFEN